MNQLIEYEMDDYPTNDSHDMSGLFMDLIDNMKCLTKIISADEAIIRRRQTNDPVN